jgi:hypothetical protein
MNIGLSAIVKDDCRTDLYIFKIGQEEELPNSYLRSSESVIQGGVAWGNSMGPAQKRRTVFTVNRRRGSCQITGKLHYWLARSTTT